MHWRVTEKERFQTVLFIASMVPDPSVISFLGVWGNIASGMSCTWRDWIFVDKTSVANFHLLHNLSPHAHIHFHKPGASPWTNPVVLGKECFRPLQFLWMTFKILTDFAVIVRFACNLCIISVPLLFELFLFIIISFRILIVIFILSSQFSTRSTL